MQFQSQFKTIEYLVEDAKVPLEATNDIGYTAIHHSAYALDLPSLKYLLGKGAVLNVKNDEGSTPLHEAVFGRIDNLPAVEYLLDNGLDPNALLDDGSMTLHVAAKENLRPDVVQVATLLVQRGANPKIKDNEGKTALDVAEEVENTFMKAYLETL